MPPPARILLVFAHPDDESFIAAGLARRCADNGGKVALVTATRGDAGRVGEPPLCARDELPERRERELRAAADALGIAELDLLDYRDKHLAEAPAGEVRDVTGRARSAASGRTSSITFDPHGMNGHADHVAISRFTLDAVAAAADPRWCPAGARSHRVQRLLWNSPVLPWEVTRPGDLRREPGVDFAVDVAAQRASKVAALRAHRTQSVPIDRCFFSKRDVDAILGLELFRQAWGPRLRRAPEDDVLAGIDLTE